MHKYTICIVVGSNHNPSHTWKLCYDIFKKINKNLDNIILKTYIYSLSGQNIEMCKGCEKCFIYGKCMCKNDDIDNIISDMNKSDMIVFASPVYLNNITGIFKNFLDRIAYLTHLLYFRRKVGIVLTSSSREYVGVALEYIKMVMTFLGISVLLCQNIYPENELEIEKYLIDEITKIIKKMQKSTVAYTNDELEKIFNNIKKYIYNYASDMYQNKSYEIKYWKEIGIDKIESFERLIHDRKV